jgi:tripartite-type tricarboxylate transporter receptor subunit TctC
MKRFTRCVAALGLLALPLVAVAQTAASFPSRPIHVICPYPPGAVTDALTRLYAAHLERKYNQSAIVENRTGAGMNIAGDAVARSAPDGYTILSASNGLAYESLLNKETPFNSQKDLLPYGIFAASGLFLTVNSALPVKNVAEFIAYVKANPGKVNVGLAGTPAAGFEEFRDRMGMTWTNVAYRGGAPAFQALLANEVQMYTTDIMQGKPAMEAGRVRMLAYSSTQRHPLAPDIPTMAESVPELKGFDYTVWLGPYLPAGVPLDIAQKLNVDVAEMQKEPEPAARLASMGWQPVVISVEELRKNSVAEVQRIADLLAKGVKLR